MSSKEINEEKQVSKIDSAKDILNDVVEVENLDQNSESESFDPKSVVDTKENVDAMGVSETLNMPVNTVKMLAYATGVIPMVGWLSSLLVLLLEKDVRVKLHAYHGLAVFGGFDVLMLLILNLSVLGGLSPLIFLVRFVLWLYVMVKVSEGKDWLLPYVGPWAKKQVEIIKKSKSVS